MVSLMFVGLIKLGFWQLERAETKLNIAQQLILNQPLKLQQLPQDNIDNQLNKRDISVSGRLLHRYTWLLDNQVKNGKVGYQVVVAAAIESEPRLALINLGWIAAPVERTTLPTLKQWSGIVQLDGKLHVPTENPYTLASPETLEWPKRIAEIDFSLLEQHTEREIVHAVIRIDQASELGYDKQWRWSNRMTVDKHKGYAFQWFALAFTLLVLTVYFGFRLTREV